MNNVLYIMYIHRQLAKYHEDISLQHVIHYMMIYLRNEYYNEVMNCYCRFAIYSFKRTHFYGNTSSRRAKTTRRLGRRSHRSLHNTLRLHRVSIRTQISMESKTSNSPFNAFESMTHLRVQPQAVEAILFVQQTSTRVIS